MNDLKKYKDRIYDIHIKDETEASKAGQTWEMGRGIMDIPAIVKTLRKIGYTGVVSLEFEKDGKNPLPGVAESIGYLRGSLRRHQIANRTSPANEKPAPFLCGGFFRFRIPSFYFIPRKCFSQAQAEASVSSIGRVAFHPSSRFANVVSAQIFSISPARRPTILCGTSTPVTFSNVSTSSITERP